MNAEGRLTVYHGCEARAANYQPLHQLRQQSARVEPFKVFGLERDCVDSICDGVSAALELCSL